jgi:NADPH:quinone reductase-like Zn-dependent oxidoreductase
MTQGHKVVVSTFADNPMDAMEHHLSLQPMERPAAASLEPHEVLISIHSAAVGWVDLLMTSGQYQHMPQPPYTPGMEYAGVVLATGTAVDPAQVKAGDRVLVDGLQVGPRSGGAYQSQGGFASYAVVPDTAAIRLPDKLSFDEACCLLGNYETAYHCLVVRGRLKAGETVLILGATGSTGLAAVHIAKLMGATVIAAGRSDAKLAFVQAQGADHVVNITHPDGSPGVRPFRTDVKALTGGRGVDLVYDGVGGEVSLESLRCTRLRRPLPDRRLGLHARRGQRARPARRPQRQPAAHQPDHDERPGRARRPHGHRHRQRSLAASAPAGAHHAMGERRPPQAPCVAHLPVDGLQGCDAGQVAGRGDRRLRAASLSRAVSRCGNQS